MHALSTVIVITTIVILRQAHLLTRIPLFQPTATTLASAKKQSIFNFLKFYLTNKPVFLEKPAFSWLHTLQEINNDRIIPMRPLKTLFLLSSVALVRQLSNMLGTPSSGVYVNARHSDRGFDKAVTVYRNKTVPLSNRRLSKIGILRRKISLIFANNITAQILRKEIEFGLQIMNNEEAELYKDKEQLEALKQKNQELEKEKKKHEKQEQERSDAKSFTGRWKTLCQWISASCQWISPYVGSVYNLLGIAAVATGVAGLINYVPVYLGNNRQDAPNNNETILMREYNSAIKNLITTNRVDIDSLRPVICNHLDNIWNAHRNNPTEFLKELIWLSAGNVSVLNRFMHGHYDDRRRGVKAIYPQVLVEAISGYEVSYEGTNGSTVTSRLAVWLAGQHENMRTVLRSRIDASFRSLNYLIRDTHPNKINVESKPITDEAAQQTDTHSLKGEYDSTTPFSGLQNLDNSFDFKQPLTRIEAEIIDYLNQKIEYRDEIAGIYNEYTGLCQQSRQLMRKHNQAYVYEAVDFDLTGALTDMGNHLQNVQAYFQNIDLAEIWAARECMQDLLNLRSSPEQPRRNGVRDDHSFASGVDAVPSSNLNAGFLSDNNLLAAAGSPAPATPSQGSQVGQYNARYGIKMV